MNNKSLTLNDLDFVEELSFFKSYYKYLLAYCVENGLRYDGEIAVSIIRFCEDVESIISTPNSKLKSDDVTFLIRIAEGRVFKELNELSTEYNRTNNHDILKNPRYKMFRVLETHGY